MSTAIAGVAALIFLGFLLGMWCRRTPKTSSPQVIYADTKATGANPPELIYTPYQPPTGSPTAGGQLLYFNRNEKQNPSQQALLPTSNPLTVASSSTSGSMRYVESTSGGSGSASGSSANVPQSHVYPKDSKVLTAGPGAHGAPPPLYLP